MKARPRAVENRVADALNEHFKRLGMSSVERIPVLGRTGPDLTLNEMNLVVDVKSRKEVPKSLFFPLMIPFRIEDMTAVRLADFNTLWDMHYEPAPVELSLKMVRDYLAHMDNWTKAHAKDGISCVILHRPEMPIGGAVAVIYSNSRRRLTEYAERYTIDHPRQ